MTYLRGYMEPGKKHSQIHLDAPGLCPVCLERYVHGAEGGGKTDLVEEVIDGVKTGGWVCPYGGRSWYQGAMPFLPPIFGPEIIPRNQRPPTHASCWHSCTLPFAVAGTACPPERGRT